MPHVRRNDVKESEPAEPETENGETVQEVGPEPSADTDTTDVRRSARVVRVRLLNSGTHPTAGVTLSHAALRLAGIDLGNKVYILVETAGRIVIEKVSWEVQRSRRTAREATPVMLRPAERKELDDVLSGTIRQLEMSALEDEQGGRRPMARSKFNRVDRLRYLGRKLR